MTSGQRSAFKTENALRLAQPQEAHSPPDIDEQVLIKIKVGLTDFGLKAVRTLQTIFALARKQLLPEIDE